MTHFNIFFFFLVSPLSFFFVHFVRPNTVSKVGGLAHSNFDNNTSQIDDNKFKKPSTVVTKSKQSQQQHNKSTRSNNNNNNGGNFDKYIGGGQTPTHSHLSASLGSTSTKKHTTNPSSLSTSTNTQPQRSHKGLSSSLVSTTGAPSSSTRSGPEPRATTNPSLSSSLPLASNSNKTVAESSKKIQYKPKQNALSKLADQVRFCPSFAFPFFSLSSPPSRFLPFVSPFLLFNSFFPYSLSITFSMLRRIATTRAR